MLPNKVINISQTFNGTWHDSTYHLENPDHTINASFSGTAVYVYFIVPNFVQYTTKLYEHIPESTSTILYNTLIFHTTNLANTDHNIEVRASGSNASILLFDNMAYTVDDADPSPSSPLSSGSESGAAQTTSATSLGPSLASPSNLTTSTQGFRSSPPISAIVGGVAGGMTVLSILLALYCCRRKRRHRLLISPRLAKWAKKPRVFLPTSIADASNTSGAGHAWPGTRPHVPSLPEEILGRARSPATASNSDTLIPDPSHHLMADSKELEPASEPAEVLGPRESSRSASTYTGSSRTGESSLRAQVTLLQEELERLRVEREMHALFVEPPPRYEE